MNFCWDQDIFKVLGIRFSTDTGWFKNVLYLLLFGINEDYLQELNLTEVEKNTKHAHFTNVKHINTIRKFVPSVLLS